MRQRGLLTGWWLAAGILSGCASSTRGPGPPPGQEPQTGNANAGLVSLDQTNDGATLLLYGRLTAEQFSTDSIRVLAARLASRSPDPDEFRIVLLDLGGQAMDTMRLWSLLGRHVWDSTGTQEQYETVAERAVAIPVPVRFGLASVRLSWPGGRDLGTVNVVKEIMRFCLMNTSNPACRR